MKALQRMATLNSRLDIKKRVAPVRAARFLLFVIFSCASTFANAETIPSVKEPLQAIYPEKISSPNNLSQSNSTQNNLAVSTPSEINIETSVSEDKALLVIQSIAQSGAIHLALLSLDNEQPQYKNEQVRWLNWERERITLLKLSKQNDKLVKRLKLLPQDIPEDFLYWAKTQQASAFLALGKYIDARQCLTKVIWKKKKLNSEFNNKWLPQWRRIIIYSYLNQGLLKDAHISMARFRQDYGQGDINDIILYARVLLMNNLADEAHTVLSDITNNPEAGMLHLLAQLRKDVRSPRKILQSSLRQMQGEWVKPELKIYLWSIVAEAAKRSDDKLSEIKAMEFIFSDENKKLLPKGLFKLKIDNLWNAYIDNAINIGNKAQYLMGDDPVWLNAAQAEEATQPINARSLYAFLILRGQNNEIKEQAIKFFLKSIIAVENGNKLVNQLFLNSKYFKSKKLIPVTVRHFMVDDAIHKTDIKLASDLMSSIKISPKGADKFMWALRRARVLVMGGKAKQSANALIQLLAEYPQMPLEDVDKLIQVVFDLQTVKAHQQAYNVFEKIITHIDDLKRQRETYYWMGDSKKAQKQYAEAASLYLKSAMLPDKKRVNSDLESSLSSNVGSGFDAGLDSSFDASFDASFDPWGQTARYQAASSLAKAGLFQDARALYTHLLKVTKDESRIKLLKHELQQLWLLESKIYKTRK